MGSLVGSFGHNEPGKKAVIVETILLFLGYVSICLRLWSRRLQHVSLQVNDYLILLAAFLMTGRYVVEVTVILLCGLGLHVAEVAAIGGPKAFVQFKQLAYADDLLWVTLVTLIKLSILHFYVKVFYRTAFVRSAYVAMGLCGAFWIGAFFTTAFFCTPPQKNWYPDIPGHCGDSNMFYTSIASTDLIIDVIVILLPMPVLWNLQMPLARKIALMGIFALGFLIIFITAIRIKFMNELDLQDPTYSFSKMAIFSAIVPLLGIINACLPLMPPAFKKIFGTSILDTQPKSSGTGTSPQWSRTKSNRSGFNESQFERLEEPEIPLVEINSRGK